MKPWFVKDTGFSSRIRPRDKAIFMRVCPDKRYRKGEQLFYAGDPATHMHVIVRGQVKLLALTPSGHERILAVCGPDDFIGEAFLCDTERYRVDAVALTEVVTCPVSGDQFKRVARKAPSFALSFAEILAAHLFDCREQLGSAYDSVKIRVAKVLMEQAERFGNPVNGTPDWYELHTELKHEEIASIVSATRVSVTMTFTELRDAGFVEGSRGRYRVHMPALTSLTEDI